MTSRARRRRRRDLGALGGGFTALVVAVALVVLTSGSAPGLSQRDTLVGVAEDGADPSAAPSESPSPSPATGTGGSSPQPSQEPAVGPSPNPSASPDEGEDPEDYPPPNEDPDAPQAPFPSQPASSPESTPVEQSGDVSRPMTRSSHAATSADCPTQGVPTTNGWCLMHTGAHETTYGATVDLKAQICRMPGQGAGTLHFAGELEIDLSVDDGAGNAWDWSSAQDLRATPHSLQVAADTCVEWSTDWPARDNDGLLMPRGGYDLLMTPATDSLDVAGGPQHTDPSDPFTVR